MGKKSRRNKPGKTKSASGAARAPSANSGSQGLDMLNMISSLGAGLGVNTSNPYSSYPYGLGNDNGMCAEEDWRNHPMGELFRLAKEDPYEVDNLLMENEKYVKGIDSLDGDGAGVLHNAALNSRMTERDAELLVEAFAERDADLNLRAGPMLSGETPLHIAAVYGHIGMVKALIKFGASCNVSDSMGRTILNRAMERNSPFSETVKLVQEALERERNDPDHAVAQTKNKLRRVANKFMSEYEFERALEKYEQLINLSGGDDNHLDYACLAHCALEVAVMKTRKVQPGFRQLFRTAYTAASKSVELNPSSSKSKIGWEILARAYIGYPEMPRAKQACAEGLKYFPDSKYLKEMWSVLDEAEVPDVVVDHESEEFKDIQHRIYVQRWIGSIQCAYCDLKCMEKPLPDKCPFCGCPVKKLNDKTSKKIVGLLDAWEYGFDMENIEALLDL